MRPLWRTYAKEITPTTLPTELLATAKQVVELAMVPKRPSQAPKNTHAVKDKSTLCQGTRTQDRSWQITTSSEHHSSTQWHRAETAAWHCFAIGAILITC